MNTNSFILKMVLCKHLFSALAGFLSIGMEPLIALKLQNFSGNNTFSSVTWYCPYSFTAKQVDKMLLLTYNI